MCKRALVRHLLWTWWVLCSTNNNNNNNTNEKQSILYWTETKPKWRKKSEKKTPAKPIPLMVKMVLNSLSMHLALDCVSVFCCCCCFFFFIIIFFVCYLFFVPCIFFVSSFLLSSHFNAPYSMLDAPHWARAVCCCCFPSEERMLFICSLCFVCILRDGWLSTLCINHPSIFCQDVSMRWIVYFCFSNILFCRGCCCCCFRFDVTQCWMPFLILSLSLSSACCRCFCHHQVEP